MRRVLRAKFKGGTVLELPFEEEGGKVYISIRSVIALDMRLTILGATGDREVVERLRDALEALGFAGFYMRPGLLSGDVLYIVADRSDLEAFIERLKVHGFEAEIS